MAQTMEDHRKRIESDHNAGIPEHEWETMEVIIGMFLRDNSLADAAAAYSVKQYELRRWLGVSQPARRLSYRIYTDCCCRRDELTTLPRATVLQRIRRGVDPREARNTPVMNKTERAMVAAMARWGAR